jgi:1-deoxy-D-xylulose-5-phosphate reductoisomerase
MDEAAPAILNAANEVSVAAFLEGTIAFPVIARTNAAVLDAHAARGNAGALRDLADVAEADRWARERAVEILESIRRGD